MVVVIVVVVVVENWWQPLVTFDSSTRYSPSSAAALLEVLSVLSVSILADRKHPNLDMFLLVPSTA